ncbi:MAG: flagellar hook-length control protein FliK [Pontiellaceae bacterium]|nr:flagellar hook-length control protein FliK [Pontiellaceae bacterium]
MEKILSSTPGVESSGKVQSEEGTPAAGFLALLGLEVEASLPNLKQSGVEIEEGVEPEGSTHLAETKKSMSGPEENWGGVPLAYIGKRCAVAKEKVQGNISEAVEPDLPKGVPLVEKESLFESMTKWAKPKKSGDVPLAMPKMDEAEGAAAKQIASVTEPVLVHPDQVEKAVVVMPDGGNDAPVKTVGQRSLESGAALLQPDQPEDFQVAEPEENVVNGKTAEQVLPEEMTMVHRRTAVPVEKAEVPIASAVSEKGPVVSDAVEDGLSTVPETQNAEVPVEEMVHRVPPMGLRAAATIAEKQSNFVKAVEPGIRSFAAAKEKSAKSASLLTDTAPPAMLLKEVPLRVEEVAVRMVPVADVQIKRDESVLKRVVAPVVPAVIEAVPSKVVSAPAVPPPMNLPSAPQMNETTMRLEQLSNQFDQRLLSMVQQNEKVMRITMEPATMGKMTVLCREENATLTVEIHVQHPAVRELIARQEEDIRRVMQECNMEVGGFDVLMSEQHNEQRQSNFDRFDSPGEFHGIAPASKEVEGVGETPVYFRRSAASWVA